MLSEFLISNRDELTKRCRHKAATRSPRSSTPAEVDHGVPLFLSQLAEALRLEHPVPNHVAGEDEPTQPLSGIGRAAALHGAQLLRQGLSVEQVVHEYGDVCQAVTELAIEENASITVDEFRTLNRCLDDAIADAVTSFGRASRLVAEERAESLHARLEHLCEQHARLVDVAINAYAAVQSGRVAPVGATGTLLAHTLAELRYLVAQSLPEIRLASAMTTLPPD